jgi:DNA-binding CsgD family transcriptional regulator
MVLHHMNELSLAGITDPERRHAAARLYRMMSSMSENDRAAYTLRFVEGLELSEIADALDVSLSTVRRAIRRATESSWTRWCGTRLPAGSRPGLSRRPGGRRGRAR